MMFSEGFLLELAHVRFGIYGDEPAPLLSFSPSSKLENHDFVSPIVANTLDSYQNSTFKS